MCMLGVSGVCVCVCVCVVCVCLWAHAHFLRLKQLNSYKNIHKAPDIFMCQHSKYHVAVQEKISGSNFLQLPNNLAKKCLSGEASWWFKCVGAFLNRSFFVSKYIFLGAVGL